MSTGRRASIAAWPTRTGSRSPPPRSPSRPLAARADVEIVGGGITGISCALTLAQAGKRVRLHEAREVASGASGRNGGFALRGGAMAYDSAREWLGAEQAAEYWRLTEAYVDRMGELGGDAFRRTGSLRLAADDDERDELRAEFEALREDGFAAEWRDELPEPLAGRFPGALFHPDDARAAACAARSAARRSRRRGGRRDPRARSRRGSGRARGRDDRRRDRRLPERPPRRARGADHPTRGQMIATPSSAVPARRCPGCSRPAPTTAGTASTTGTRIADGRILAGGFRDFDLESEFTTSEETTPRIQGALDDFVEQILGRRPVVTHRWAGVFGLVPDLMPVVGRVPGRDGLWVAGGYSGHGNVLGLMCGDLVAQAILGDPHPLLELIDPARLVA